MSAAHQCLVSIVTPVYNGGAYLRRCIESVLNQTHQNWRYTILNNRSTDDSLAIAEHYARLDPRIRVHDGTEFLPVIDNHNRAMSFVDPAADYCKPLMADDWLYPECIERMVGSAATNPGIGLVCAYGFSGSTVMYTNITGTDTVSFMPGRTACRTALLDEGYFFGSPTTMLIRADLVRKRKPFYNTVNLHADEESCYDILQESDFCFIHQILYFLRLHDQSQTTKARAFQSVLVGRIYSLKKYGAVYLTRAEFERRMHERYDEYYSVLAVSALRLAPKPFWQYHRQKLLLLGTPLDRRRLTVAMLRHILRRFGGISKIFESVMKRWWPSNLRFRKVDP